jgi:hypothetical protein
MYIISLYSSDPVSGAVSTRLSRQRVPNTAGKDEKPEIPRLSGATRRARDVASVEIRL